MTLTYREDRLWLKLQSMEFDGPDTVFPIHRKVEAETGLTPSKSATAIAEYKKHIYLAMRAGHPIVPPREVEDVWKIHLTHTRHYWKTMCSNILGHPLHYRSAAMLDDEFRPNIPFVEITRQSYEETFGRPEPPVGGKFRRSLEQIRTWWQSLAALAGSVTIIIGAGLPAFLAALLLYFTHHITTSLWDYLSLRRAMLAPHSTTIPGPAPEISAEPFNVEEDGYPFDPMWQHITAMDLEGLGAPTESFPAELAKTTGWTKNTAAP